MVDTIGAHGNARMVVKSNMEIETLIFKEMKKKMQLTPEWVLCKLSHTQYVDGEGNISVYAGNASDANWIELALESLNIEYEVNDYLADDGLF
jgi:hypothetical protein